ncbi:MAG: hypothetical protein FWC91_13055 [Defluviitaleaceae bacterium]|nr:hypothetical protein [Defluviitaleaceae bacterium]
MNKKNIMQFHEKFPYIESIAIFLFGTFIGFLLNLFTNDINTNSVLENWRWIDSLYFWIILILITVVIIYYIFFSSYAIGKIKSEPEEKALINELLNQGKKELKRDIVYKEKLNIVHDTFKTIHKIHKIDK